MLRSHAAPDNMLDVASRRCGRTGEDGVAAGGPVRPGRRGCSMGFQISDQGRTTRSIEAYAPLDFPKTLSMFDLFSGWLSQLFSELSPPKFNLYDELPDWQV